VQLDAQSKFSVQEARIVQVETALSNASKQCRDVQLQLDASEAAASKAKLATSSRLLWLGDVWEEIGRVRTILAGSSDGMSQSPIADRWPLSHDETIAAEQNRMSIIVTQLTDIRLQIQLIMRRSEDDAQMIACIEPLKRQLAAATGQQERLAVRLEEKVLTCARTHARTHAPAAFARPETAVNLGRRCSGRCTREALA
jgi:hypothetical protein